MLRGRLFNTFRTSGSRAEVSLRQAQGRLLDKLRANGYVERSACAFRVIPLRRALRTVRWAGWTELVTPAWRHC